MSNRVSKNKFNGKRLKAAREHRGKSTTELGNELEVSRQYISSLENNINTPNFQIISGIINKLDFPKGYFFEEDKMNIECGDIYFRSLSKTRKSDRVVQNQRLTELSKIYHFLSKHIQFPKLNLPKLDILNNSIEDIAMETRKFWGINDEPINNIIYLLEKNGIVMSSFDIGIEDIDAYSARQIIDGNLFHVIILGKDDRTFVRRQFNAAHELGHIILHQNLVNSEDFITKQRELEKEAHSFAGAFLLPKDAFTRDLTFPNDLEFYKSLKKKWKVSIAAMLFRARDLDIISQYTYKSLIQKMAIKDWRKREPLDNVISIKSPVLLKKATEMLIVNDRFTPETFMHTLSSEGLTLYSHFVEEILGLEEGYLKVNNSFEENDDTLVSLKLT